LWRKIKVQVSILSLSLSSLPLLLTAVVVVPVVLPPVKRVSSADLTPCLLQLQPLLLPGPPL
jgi:hypothetical protein